VQELWNQIFQKGVKGEILRDILMFYFQRKVFSPPPQKSYDVLVTFSAKGISRKMKTVIFQILEEICPCLESSIVETLSFSANNSVTIELMNCILVGGFVPLLDESAMERLFRYVLFHIRLFFVINNIYKLAVLQSFRVVGMNLTCSSEMMLQWHCACG
jgi:hypothetical protein